MTAVRWHNNGLGEPMCTDWLSGDEPVGPLIGEAGPSGWTEIDDDGRVRVWRPYDWALGS